MSSGSVRSVSHRHGSSGGVPEPDRVVNAFWRGDDVIHVVHDDAAPGGVRMRSNPAEHSAFVLAAELPEGYENALKRHSSVRGIVPEGEWLRLKFRSRDHCKDFCAAAASDDIPTYEGAISPVTRWLADNDIKVARPRIAWTDIETDSRVPFSIAREGGARILSWAIVDTNGRTESAILRADTDDREHDLMAAFWEVADDYDLIAAWNGDRFDFPIIKYRSESRGLMIGREWRRQLWLDHLELFRRMNMMAAESGEEKQSFRLDVIAQALLGEGKHDFDAAFTWQAWAAGGQRRQELLDYNIQDTALMPRIEEKTGYIELLLTLGQVCGTFGDSRGINPQTQVESYLQRLALARGQKIPTARPRKVSEQYKGAFVMDPTRAGILTNVHVADFASLYPTIICTWNMSPETMIDKDKVATNLDGTPLDEHVSFSPLTDVYFKTDEQGILPAAVEEMMRLRKEWKTRKAAAIPGTSEWKEADRRSTAYKIAANSFYGVIGAPTSRFFRRQVAESVAQCGAWLIQETIAEAERQGMEVIYGDTDSLFVIGATRTSFELFVEDCNNLLYPRILEEMGCKAGLISLAYEKAFKRVVFTTAKRYVGSYLHYDGTEADENSKPEIKGLEFKRGDSARAARLMQEEIAYLIVGYKQAPSDDPVDYEVILRRWRQYVLIDDLPLDDVMVSKRLGRPLDGYVRKKKKDGEWARQPPHVEIARVLEQRGRDVGEGAKIEYFVSDGSTKPATIVPAEDWDGDCDRHHLWETLVAPPTLRLLEAAFPGHDWKPFAKTRPKKRGKKKATGRRLL